MTGTRAAVLTPPGSAAIAVLAVRGPGAWAAIRNHFHPARGNPLPETPAATGVRFGRFGGPTGDEVILVVRGPETFEVHCHGGRQVVGWLLDLLRSAGVEEVPWAEFGESRFADPTAAALLPFARTVRTAAILLDQAHGAYDRAVRLAEEGGPEVKSVVAVLRRNARVGRHLVEPWTVAIAGAPNAGKSTLMNALAGFNRSVVSPVPGTTRDAVSVSLAFVGWPVDVVDTAGLRDAPDALEREGVDRARRAVADSDLCLWVVDATGPRPGSVAGVAKDLGRPAETVLVVLNKCDLATVPEAELPDAVRVSAVTGQGLPDLAARIAAALVPEPPGPGEPVPFTPEACERWR